MSLVDASVAAYQRRGFKNLMVSFGCTGGQHRSVYLAEQLAKHLRGTAAWKWWSGTSNWRDRQVRRGESMKAMILAAGLGTRLRPLTDDRPKALVTVAGRTLLEITLSRLRSFGVREVIVNAHHYRASMIVDYLEANDNFGMRIEVSREEELLDTGGGLKKAAWFFLEAGADSAQPIDAQSRPFLVHNVDVLSTIDLAGMMRFHAEHSALATLAVQERETSRYLLFDEQGQLCGRRAGRDGRPELSAPRAASPGARFFRHPRPLAPHLRHDSGRRRLFHHRRLSASRGAGRKDSRLPRRWFLLARSRPAGEPQRSRTRCGERNLP